MSAVAGLLEGKVAIVTGAGRGIGAATARHLCQLGARVAVTDRHVGPAHQVAEALEAEGHDVVALEADVGDGASISAMVAAVVERFGGVDLLDHNAAWTDFRTDLSAEDVDLATWDKVLATNATGGLLLVRAVLPLMRARGGGSIVLISSGSATRRHALRPRRDPLQRDRPGLHPHRYGGAGSPGGRTCPPGRAEPARSPRNTGGHRPRRRLPAVGACLVHQRSGSARRRGSHGLAASGRYRLSPGR